MGHFLIFILETFFKESYLYSHANNYCRKMVIVNATSVGRYDLIMECLIAFTLC